MSKKGIIAIISSAAAFVALLIIATFLDLQINIALGNSESVFGQFFSYLGETPAWIAVPIAGIMLYQAVKKTNKYYKYLKIAFLVLSFVGFILFVNYIGGKIFIELKAYWLYVILFALIGTFLSVIATNKVDKGLMEKLVIFALFLLAVVAISQGIVTVMKMMWGRQRFRNMEGGNVSGGDTSGFTPWYKATFGKHNDAYFYPDALGGAHDEDAYKSFPSGHTAAAGVTFVVIMLPELFEKLKKYKIWFYVLPAVYTFLVAISRIVNRAHFLSDVLFGGTVTIITVFVCKWLAYLIRDKILARHTLPAEEAEDGEEVALEPIETSLPEESES